MGQAAKNPDAYGAYYQRYVTAALSRPYMIGYNKCQYQDEPTPKLLKQGMLDINEQPYPIVERVREANFLALDHAYEGTEPKFEALKPEPTGQDVPSKALPCELRLPPTVRSFQQKTMSSSVQQLISRSSVVGKSASTTWTRSGS